MNYLAHAYLSFGNEEILLGNMISDFVKGRKKFDFLLPVQKGITLHRAIDMFTDEHTVTKQANKFFRPAVGLYAGAFTDVVYDHFLAADATNWKEISLRDFSNGVYATLSKHNDLLPGKLQQMFPYMKRQDWLYNYQFKWGTAKSFEGLVRRALYLDTPAGAFDAFEKHYDDLHQLSQIFIADVKKFASDRFSGLMKD